MNYVEFLLKKGLKSRLTLLATALVILTVLTCLGFNLRNQHLDTLEAQAKSQIATDINTKHAYSSKELKNDPHGDISLLNADMKVNKDILNSLQRKKWQSAYKKQMTYNNQQLNTPSNGSRVDKHFKEFLLSQNFLCRALSKLNIADQSESSPTTGITFFLYIDDIVSSILVTLLIIFICSQLYTRRFARFLDKDTLLPIGIGKGVLSNLSAGYTLAIALSLLVMLVSFLTSASFSGIGNFHYPFPYYTPKLPFNIYMPQNRFIIPTIILRILSSCFVVTCVYFLALLTKQMVTTLLLTLLILIGTNQLTSYIWIFSKIGHYLPTSYFNGVGVSTGRLAYFARDNQINFQNGVIALISWTILFILATYGLQYIRQNQRKRFLHP